MAIRNIKITYQEAKNTCSNKTKDSANAQAEAESGRKTLKS